MSLEGVRKGGEGRGVEGMGKGGRGWRVGDGREGREERDGRDDCYTYSNGTTIFK